MRSSNNELTVYRNETFAIDRTLVNNDGSPYVVSNKLNNPHLLITVTSSKFAQTGRYELSYFLPIDQMLPRFNMTNVINLKDLLSYENDEPGESLYDDWPSLSIEKDDETGLDFIITCYYNGELVRIEPNDAVFYLEKDGNIEYKYFDVKSESWKDYVFRFVHTFNKSETSKWIGQSYQYSILLVSGEDTLSYLQELCTMNGLSTEGTKQELYDSLIKIGFNFEDDFDIESPLATYDATFPILIPTKLSVLSNLRGGMR